jgi:ABC-2 type transport system permease protein
MRPDIVRIVAKREYLLRIKSKGFWIATLVLPLFIGAVTVLPSLLVARSHATLRIVTVDETGRVAPALLAEGSAPAEAKDDAGDLGDRGDRGNRSAASLEITSEPVAGDAQAQRAALDRRVLAKEIDAWMWIDRGVIDGKPVEYHARSVSNFISQEVLRDRISSAVRRVRFAEAGLDADKIGQLSKRVDVDTIRVSEKGSRAEGGIAGAAFAYILFFMLYMVMMIWGQQVMTGILEEKGSRVIEVVVSAVKPFELMMGKLTGICLVGLTQLVIWLTTAAVLTAPGILTAMDALPPGVKLPTLTPVMILHFVVLFVLGFFVFSTFYAAIGASFNNVQEAQQVAGIAVFVLILPFFLMMRIINDPNSTLAVVTSMIPLFTPLLMALRISLEMPPLWQILLSEVLTLGFVWCAVWFCGRIYRVGILMYGKKPTVQEIWRWVRYS